MANMEDEKIKSFMENVRSKNTFGIKLFLDLGIIKTATLNDALKLCMNTYSSIDIIKLLLTYGAQMPSNVYDLIKLPDELFYEYINNIPYNVNIDLLYCLVYVKNLTEKKWNYMTSDFDLENLEMDDRFDLLDSASENLYSGFIAFKSLLEPVLDNKQFLYRLLLDIGSPEIQCYKCCEYLIDQLFLNENEILLCELLNLQCMDNIYRKNNSKSYPFIESIKDSPSIKKMIKDIVESDLYMLNDSNNLAKVDQWLTEVEKKVQSINNK